MKLPSLIAAAGLAGAANGQAPANLAKDPKLAKVVSFRGKLTLRELPDWLAAQGVNFVIPDADRFPDRTIAMNIVNKPLRDVMTALAISANGKWIATNGIYSLQVPLIGFWGMPPPPGPRPPGGRTPPP